MLFMRTYLLLSLISDQICPNILISSVTETSSETSPTSDERNSAVSPPASDNARLLVNQVLDGPSRFPDFLFQFWPRLFCLQTLPAQPRVSHNGVLTQFTAQQTILSLKEK